MLFSGGDNGNLITIVEPDKILSSPKSCLIKISETGINSQIIAWLIFGKAGVTVIILEKIWEL